MSNIELDKTDRKILPILQSDGGHRLPQQSTVWLTANRTLRASRDLSSSHRIEVSAIGRGTDQEC